MSILIELLPTAGSVLIVGGGNVALRRAAQFSAAGFQLYVVAPVVASGFADLPNTTVDTRAFQDSDEQKAKAIAYVEWILSGSNAPEAGRVYDQQEQRVIYQNSNIPF